MNTPDKCYFFHFGLIVTGKGEEKHLPKLFKSLENAGICHFEVLKKVGQRSHITSEKRKLKMVGEGKIIPDKDTYDIGFPARGYLKDKTSNGVILIDDMEHERRSDAKEIFSRYRAVFDKILLGEQKRRASVHFLRNMLEAYYFADADAVNKSLNLETPLSDYPGDVEEIRHPKGDMKQLCTSFDEVSDGGKILDRIDVPHILSRRDTCACLRTLFKWCSDILTKYMDEDVINTSFLDKYRLNNGKLCEITEGQ